MAFPLTPILDDFAGSVGADANWTRLTSSNATAVVLTKDGSGHAIDTSGTLYSWSYWNPRLFIGPDCEAYTTIFARGGAVDTIRVGVRVSQQGTTNQSGYYINVQNTTDVWSLQRITAGATTSLTTGPTQHVNASDKVGISAIGAILTAYWYDSANTIWNTMTTYDVTLDATKYMGAGPMALEFGFGGTLLDDFGGGTLVAAQLPSFEPVPFVPVYALS